MSEAQRLELIRARLKMEMEAANSEINFIKEIILVSKETNTPFSDVLEWPWPRYVVVVEAIREMFKEINNKCEIENIKHLTLGGL